MSDTARSSAPPAAQKEAFRKPLAEAIDPSLFEFARFDEDAGERIGYSDYSYWRSTLKVFFKNKTAVVLLVLLTILLLFTFIQPLIPGQNSPTKIHIDPATGIQMRNRPPDSEFWFGTNSIGQDLWARIWSGTRTSLLIGLIVGIVEMVVGILYGALWGYVRKLDRVLTEIYNVLNNIPTTIILLLMAYILRPGFRTMIIAIPFRPLSASVGVVAFTRVPLRSIRNQAA